MNSFLNQFPYSDFHEMNLDWILKTMKKLAAEMNDFEAANSIKYEGIWDITKQYTAWAIVNYGNESYIASKPVPQGIPLSDSNYWNFLGLITVDQELNSSSLNPISNKSVTNKFNLVDIDINYLKSGLTSETAARTSADAAMQADISDLQTDLSGLSNSLDTEIADREAADALINGRIDEITSIPGSTTGDIALADIKVGWDGKTWSSPGNAVRGQITELHDNLGDLEYIHFNEFVVGNYNAAGGLNFVAGTIRLNDFIVMHKGDIAKLESVPSGYEGILALFDYSDKHIVTTSLNSYTASGDIYLMVRWNKVGSSDITADDPNVKGCATLTRSTRAKYDEVAEIAEDLSNKYDEAHRHTVTTSQGNWTPTGKGTGYNNYWCCVDNLLYIKAGGYIENPNGYRFNIVKFASNDVKTYQSVIDVQNLKITLADDGWYGICWRKNDYSTLAPSSMPASQFHLYFDDAHAPEELLHAYFLGGGKNLYPLNGDSTLFVTPHGKKFAVDLGGEIGQNYTKSCLYEFGGLKLDALIVSHYHNDHIGGIVLGLENGWLDLNGATVYLPDQAAMQYVIDHNLIDSTSLNLYNRLMTALGNLDVTLVYPSADMQTVEIDGVIIRFFNTVQTVYNGETDDYNNYSLCNYVIYGDTKICMTGDISLLAENTLAGKLLKCDILKAMHHGWDGQEAWLSSAFMNNVYPEVLITEDGIVHEDRILTPGAAQQSWCERYNVPNYRTNSNGPVSVRVSRSGYSIESVAAAYIRLTKNWTWVDNSIYQN